jgi:hypothetical protein
VVPGSFPRVEVVGIDTVFSQQHVCEKAESVNGQTEPWFPLLVSAKNFVIQKSGKNP